MTGSAFIMALGWVVVMTLVMATLVAIAKRVVRKTLRARWTAYAVLELVPLAFVVAAFMGAFIYPNDLGLEGEIALPFAVVVVCALPWIPLALFALIVMPLREMRAISPPDKEETA